MRFNNHLKASKIFTKPSLEFIQSSRILPERSLLSSTRCTRVCRDTSFSKPTILNRSLNKTERLQKSLESIRAKRSKIILKRNYFNEKRNTKLFIKEHFKIVDKKLEKAAIIIQKFVRGYLIKKRYKPLIHQHTKEILAKKLKSLKNKVNFI